MTNKTKDQLVQELAAKRSEAEEKDRRLAELEAELEAERTTSHELARRGEGWLIRTPDPGFEGARYGVRFQYGQAFILRDQKVPGFEFEPQEVGGLRRAIANQYPPPYYTEAEREEAFKSVREREMFSSAERAAAAFEKDLGYQVEWYSAERLMNLEQDMADQAQKAAAILKAREEREQAELVTQPGRF